MPAVTIFSKNLRNLLEERNRTQKDLADYIGVSPASVNFWFNASIQKQKTQHMVLLILLSGLDRKAQKEKERRVFNQA